MSAATTPTTITMSDPELLTCYENGLVESINADPDLLAHVLTNIFDLHWGDDNPYMHGDRAPITQAGGTFLYDLLVQWFKADTDLPPLVWAQLDLLWSMLEWESIVAYYLIHAQIRQRVLNAAY